MTEWMDPLGHKSLLVCLCQIKQLSHCLKCHIDVSLSFCRLFSLSVLLLHPLSITHKHMLVSRPLSVQMAIIFLSWLLSAQCYFGDLGIWQSLHCPVPALLTACANTTGPRCHFVGVIWVPFPQLVHVPGLLHGLSEVHLIGDHHAKSAIFISCSFDFIHWVCGYPWKVFKNYGCCSPEQYLYCVAAKLSYKLSNELSKIVTHFEHASFT